MNYNNYYTLEDFDYQLPPELIAQQPLAKRTQSRLLCLDRTQQTISHQQFPFFVDLIQPGDVLVFNNTKVMPSRLYGHKESGGQIECLIERVVSSSQILAHIRASKAPKLGSKIFLGNSIVGTVSGRAGELFCIEIDTSNNIPIIETILQQGELPLPHYIDHKPDMIDYDRYQTVYAKELGAIAAPTAGLHFDAETMLALKQKGVEILFITLHVGSGTFKPIRNNDLSQHQMHSEYIEIPEEVCNQITNAKNAGKRIIGVGTTVVRALETAANSGELIPFSGETNLFIRPGFHFNVIDGLLTNFHLPQSSLLILVSAFAGYDLTMRAYYAAIEQKYRFFSYGDAMFILPKTIYEV